MMTNFYLYLKIPSLHKTKQLSANCIFLFNAFTQIYRAPIIIERNTKWTNQSAASSVSEILLLEYRFTPSEGDIASSERHSDLLKLFNRRFFLHILYHIWQFRTIACALISHKPIRVQILSCDFSKCSFKPITIGFTLHYSFPCPAPLVKGVHIEAYLAKDQVLSLLWWINANREP